MIVKAASLAGVGAVFKTCSNCVTQWASVTTFLQDPDIHLTGYMPTFDALTDGLFLFNHCCGTTLACPVGQFAHLYDGPIYQTNFRGEGECPGHCMHQTDFAPCPQECSCAFVRKTMHIIDQWPKNENP